MKQEKAPAWVRRVMNATKPAEKGKYFFDWKEAERRVKFIEGVCRYPEGKKAGQLIELEQWQKEQIIYPAFGWKRKGSGLRRYRTIFVFIPRKNAKTTLIACVGLSILFQDNEHGAQMYCLGSVKDQSAIIYRIMKSMINNSPVLSSRMKLKADQFDYGGADSFVKVLANSPGKHGLNAHALFVDELHEFLLPKHLEALEAIETSMISRSQPITFVMTTAGHDTNSRCFEDYLYAKDVASGRIKDDQFLPLVYEAGKDADWTDPKAWKRANPGLGNIIPKENFEIEFQKALKRPHKVNSFKRLHLNMWANQLESWIDDGAWTRAKLDFSEDDVRHLPCWMGMDLASTRDLCAVSMLWVDVVEWKFYLRVHHWVNEEKAGQRKLAKGVDYFRYQDEGSVTITDGNVTDHGRIMNFIIDFATKNDVKTLAYDKALSSYIVAGLVDAGIECQPFSQGILHMSYPIKQFEIEVENGNLSHDGSACMRWQMACVVIKRDENDNVKITKNMGNEAKKVDGPISAVMALGQFMEEQGDDGGPSSFTVIGLD